MPLGARDGRIQDGAETSQTNFVEEQSKGVITSAAHPPLHLLCCDGRSSFAWSVVIGRVGAFA